MYAAVVFFVAKDAGQFSALSIVVIVVLALGAVGAWTGRRVGLWVGFGASALAGGALLVAAVRDGESSGFWLAVVALVPAALLLGALFRRPVRRRADRSWLWFLVFGALGVVAGVAVAVTVSVWPGVGAAAFGIGFLLFGAVLRPSREPGDGRDFPASGWRVAALVGSFGVLAVGAGVLAFVFGSGGQWGGAGAFGLAAVALLVGLVIVVVRGGSGVRVSDAGLELRMGRRHAVLEWSRVVSVDLASVYGQHYLLVEPADQGIAERFDGLHRKWFDRRFVALPLVTNSADPEAVYAAVSSRLPTPDPTRTRR
ncbi:MULTISPECIES: hypothetical protein [unclassified Saccharothrix]|uniref:hypothetical protein n=1 Tax=unclassified Saccharothrix TaxID=2593673 RepID=UPI00307F8989